MLPDRKSRTGRRTEAVREEGVRPDTGAPAPMWVRVVPRLRRRRSRVPWIYLVYHAGSERRLRVSYASL
jgi:hypothetical protein